MAESVQRRSTILQLLPSVIRGGAEEYGLTMARCLASRGWNVVAGFPLVSGMSSLARDYAAANIRVLNLPIGVPSGRTARDFSVLFPAFGSVVCALMRVRPSVVHIALPWPDGGCGAVLACGVMKVPTVAVFQLVKPKYEFVGRMRVAHLWAKQRRQKWVCVSDENRSVLARGCGLSEDDIERVYNGAGGGESEVCSDLSGAERIAARREFGLTEGDQLLLSVGRLDRQKGFDLLPGVMQSVLREFPRCVLAIAGEGSERLRLTEAFRSAGVLDHVRILGFRSDVSRLMRISDMLVFPSRFEGQPFSLIEAMSAGLPVVASNVSGIPEIVQDGVSGVLFESDDASQLYEKIVWMLRNRVECRLIGERGRERAKWFSERRMVDETEALLLASCAR